MSVDHVRNDISSMRSMLAQIRSLGDRIGGVDDNPQLRAELQDSVRRLTSLAQSTKATIQSLVGSGDPDVASLQQSFTEATQEMQQQLPPVINALRSRTSNEPGRRADVYHQPLLDQAFLDDETETLEALEQRVNEILTAMREVNALFNQTYTKIQEQRHLLVSLDQNISNAVDEMSEANAQLDQAAQKQKGSTRCLCWIAVVVSVIVAGVILFLVLWLKK
jgi:chromosome segregation ATPase